MGWGERFRARPDAQSVANIGRPREYHGPRITTAVRLPADLHARLKAAASERTVSANRIVERAIERYLDDLGEGPVLP